MAAEHSCPNCNEFIKPGWQICPYCGQTQSGFQKIIRCRVCSRKVISALHTCPYCAAYLEPKPFPVFQVSFATIIVVVLVYGVMQWGTAVSNGAQQMALLINPPTPTFTPTATATFTPTFTPSATPTPTETSTPIPTSTDTPVPSTSTPTPTQTSTNAPTAPPTATPTFTITPTPTPRFDKPTILGPEDGTLFAREQELILQWEDIGPLGPNEFYAVRLVWQQDGQPAYGGTNLKENFWKVPADAYWGLADEFTGREYEWYVYVEEIATDDSGQQVGRPVSEVSDTRTFLWQ